MSNSASSSDTSIHHMQPQANERSQLAALEMQLKSVTLKDQHALGKRLEGLQRRLERQQPIDRGLLEARKHVEKSRRQVEVREAQPLSIRYPEGLPVSARHDTIMAALKEHQVIIVAGETGSGKTTQLPKMCLELGLGTRGIIGHTQPRRLAARSVAARLAEELETPLGSAVGYQMRFSDNTGPETRVKLMTDGILLAETQHDPDLLKYDAIIIDEAHERSLNIDFLLGYLKRLLARRADLKVIITSATIDLERFSHHFAKEVNGKDVPAPIIEVSGRTFDVDTLYRPLVRAGEDEEDISLQEGILQAVEEIETLERERHWFQGPRDILVFLPGEREIRETADTLRRAQLRHTEVLPLYARLSASEQNRVFASHAGRRIVLATNVAETSLTVPGIRYVIDPGLARISRYSYRAKIQRLPIEPISQASADQRKGRCGRVAEGICIRLYSEEDFLSRPAFTDPEIKRTNLAAVILSMLALKLGDIARFPFIDPPDARFVRDGFRLLEELEAVEQQKITHLGRQLARLPIDPRLARMVLAGDKIGCLREILVVVSALAVQDPRERPAEKREAADQAHREWADPASDFAAWINLWNGFNTAREELSSSALRRWCRTHYLNYMRLREWHDTYRQLRQLARELGLGTLKVSEEVDYEKLHRALLTGLLSHLGTLSEGREYLGARNRKFMIHPSSYLKKKTPKWIMAFELLETSRLFAREVASIRPEWIEEAGKHLLKRSHSEPHWESKRGQVVALESATLFGLPVYARRRVGYGKINPLEARDIFIRSGLVEGELRTNARFMAHNQALVEEVETLEDKARRRDILVDDEELYQFYDERLPEGISDSRSFERWRKKEEAKDPHILFADKNTLMARDATEVTENDYPEALQLNRVELPLGYHFAPGQRDDGVTMTVPVVMLKTLPRARLDWLVPGLRREKAIALLKGLPKQYRRQVVPIPDWVDAALEAITPCESLMGEALGDFLRQKTGVRIPAELWQEVELPSHLQLNIRVVDATGKLLGHGRDIDQLIQQFSQQANAAEQMPAAGKDSNTPPQPLTQWPATPLPEKEEQVQAGIRVTLYPALTDAGEGLAVKQFDYPETAHAQHRQGVKKAAMLALPELYSTYARSKAIEPLAVMYTQVGQKKDLVDDLMNALFLEAFAHDPLPRTAEAMSQRIAERKSELHSIFQHLTHLLAEVLREVLDLQRMIKKARIGLDVARSYADVKAQLANLVYKGFIADAGNWLEEYPRYLNGARIRLEKVAREVRRDQLAMDEIQTLESRFNERATRMKESGITEPWLNEFFWQLQELRVSLFAQQLGTVEPVSVKRLEKRWKESIKEFA
ncbi:DEAD [Halomonadaceae bacterium LMG 33818]